MVVMYLNNYIQDLVVVRVIGYIITGGGWQSGEFRQKTGMHVMNGLLHREKTVNGMYLPLELQLCLHDP